MLTKNSTKWGVSIILAGILLALTFIGGNWGTTFAANDIDDYFPVIDYIYPEKILAGSPDTQLVVIGSGFGNSSNTAVKVGADEVFYGYVTETGILVNLPSRLFVNPITYDVSVVMSNPDTLPTIPITPWDVESNAVPLKVVEAQSIYLPIVLKNALRK